PALLRRRPASAASVAWPLSALRLYRPCRPCPACPSSCLSRSYVNHFAVRLEETHPAPVLERANAHAVAFLARRIEKRNVGHVQRHLFFDYPASHAFHRVRT